MTELGTLNTAYPDTNPWFDLRPLLVNGWRSVGSQTCGVSVLPNLLIWSIRLIGDDATSYNFIDGLPNEIRTPQDIPIPIITPKGSTYCMVYRNVGRITINSPALAVIGGWDRKGELVVAGVTPRGTPA
ncbi:hypothetical protein ACLQ8T_06280 [Glutamicibacter sp. FR1]|uniref:hypothetical protein n=1 Tax=Glutamicibacter sp. FR1 TaxID=3393744 RepID=UPI0039B10336